MAQIKQIPQAPHEGHNVDPQNMDSQDDGDFCVLDGWIFFHLWKNLCLSQE